ncbi:MAG: DNA translocase FtsK [Lachnospiraceae bacterium]
MAQGVKKKKLATKKKQAAESLSWQNEAVLIGLLAVSVLLFISNFGVGGKIGGIISSFFFGLFGIIAYGFPVLLFLGSLFIASNGKNKIAWMKVAFGVLFLILLCTFVEMVAFGTTATSIKTGYYQGFYLKKGGGVFGTMMMKVLQPNLGTIGAYVVTIAGLIISIIFITERSIFSGMRKKSKVIYESTKEEAVKRSELREEKKLHREEEKDLNKKRRTDCKQAGVVLYNKLKRQTEPGSDEMSELHITEMEQPLEEHMSDLIQLHQQPEEEAPMERVAEPVPSNPVEKKNSAVPKSVPEAENEIPLQSNRCDSVPDSNYQFPPIHLLKKGNSKQKGDTSAHLRDTAIKLEQTLRNFGVKVSVTNVCCGPSVTRYELQPEQGVKVNRIVNLADDIKLNLAATDIRIEAPIPGKAAVGIEVPNKENVTVMLRDLIETDIFKNQESKITFAAGKDIGGKVIVSDIGKMPHVLIAGATGSGKSVCINTIIMSILYKAKPEEVKLIMIDPKVVELSVYNGIPHLMIPVVTDPKKAAGALHWAVAEMTERYQKFADYNVRDLKGFNAEAKLRREKGIEDAALNLPQIVIIVDELADLMMVAPGDVEDAICRLAQLARAAGIHLIIATQRPSVNVITGLIKANMPSRVAFAVSSGVDSRTILDMNGAEKLLGKGDMLFYPQGYQKPLRVQGAFVSDKEVADVVEFVSKNHPASEFDSDLEEKLNTLASGGIGVAIGGSKSAMEEERDIYFGEAGKFLIEKEKGSIGMLQRIFKIGFNRAARIMDQLEEAGVVGPEEGTKPRKVLMTLTEFQEYIDEC